MQREQVDRLTPGKLLNALVAEAMGWYMSENLNNGWRTVTRPDGTKCEEFKSRMYSHEEVYARFIPDFSGDISAAWQIVEFMEPAHRVHISTYDEGLKYGCRFENSAMHEYSLGKTAPEAICKALLMARG